MFWRLFITQLRTTLADKATVFWTIMFPVILGTLFNFAFSGLNGAYQLKPVPVAVVDNTQYASNESLKRTVEGLSNGDDALFDAKKFTSRDEALSQLDEMKVSGVIESDNGKATMHVKGVSDFNETIIKTAVEQSLQTQKAVIDAAKYNPAVMQKISEIGTTEYLKDTTGGSIDRSAIYFYTLIGMACMYASFLGIIAINRIEANQSKLAMRLSVSPVSKAKALMAVLSSAYVVTLTSQTILYVYLTKVLGINFGAERWAVFLVMVVGSLVGLMLGALVGVSSRHSEEVKINISLSVTMLFSMLAGMMGSTAIKYAIDQNIPLLGKINPVNLISDSLYATYYFGVDARYWNNLTILSAFVVVTAVLVWVLSRRKSYASL